MRQGQPDECWPWRTGAMGTFTWRDSAGRVRHAKGHRIAFWLTKGDIPADKVIAHLCDNPPCCNPAHLELWTQFENMQDMASKGRHPYNASQRFRETRKVWHSKGKHGENKKLTMDQAREIRHRYAAGSVRQIDLAREYGVYQTTISKIIRFENYKEE